MHQRARACMVRAVEFSALRTVLVFGVEVRARIGWLCWALLYGFTVVKRHANLIKIDAFASDIDIAMTI